MTRKDDKGDQPSGGETTWTNTGATRSGIGQHKIGSLGEGMLRPSPHHGTQRLPNDDDDYDDNMYGSYISHFPLVRLCQTFSADFYDIFQTCFPPGQSMDLRHNLGFYLEED